MKDILLIRNVRRQSLNTRVLNKRAYCILQTDEPVLVLV